MLLEQEASVDSVPKHWTLSSQIGPVVDPNLQNVNWQTDLTPDSIMAYGIVRHIIM